MDDKNEKIILSLQQYNQLFKAELDADNSDFDDLLRAFYGLAISATFQPKTIKECMQNLIEEF